MPEVAVSQSSEVADTTGVVSRAAAGVGPGAAGNHANQLVHYSAGVHPEYAIVFFVLKKYHSIHHYPSLISSL
jgi:hypothetical protein